MRHIQILTYNIQFGKHTDRIIDWVNRQSKYDIFCFQEFPQDKIHESISVLGRLPYGYKFTASLKRRGKIYGQLTLYRKDRMTLRHTKIITLGINRLEKSIIKNTIPRSCLLTTFNIGKEILLVANIHLVALTINKYKYIQAEAVINALVRRVCPVVILGDFNLSSILGKKQLFYLMEKHAYTTDHARISTHRVGVFRHQFDYIFGKHCTVVYKKIKSIRLSDHLPIAATIRIA
jgi:endonuclease/exonuclease/phosphatase family metal-dependent hydrolase